MTGVLRGGGRSRARSLSHSRKRSKRPHVTLKLAVSADGMIGREGRRAGRITGPPARGRCIGLRARTDAILVGIGTAIADDPELTVRLPGLEARSPVRIVLDRRLACRPARSSCASAREVPAGGSPPPESRSGRLRRRWRRHGARSILASRLRRDRIAPPELLGGARRAGHFLAAGRGRRQTAQRASWMRGLVDRIVLFTGPGTLGEDGRGIAT